VNLVASMSITVNNRSSAQPLEGQARTAAGRVRHRAHPVAGEGHPDRQEALGVDINYLMLRGIFGRQHAKDAWTGMSASSRR